MEIKDSGERREFDSGAVRDISEGKGRCDLMPLDVVSCVLNDMILNEIASFVQTHDTFYLCNVLNHFADRAFNGSVPTMMLEVAIHFEDGARKYGEYNWQKGIPVHCYIDSAVRHYLKWRRGDNDERHDRSFVWNILCCMWTMNHKSKMNDLRVHDDESENTISPNK